MAPLASYRAVIIGYALLGAVLALLFSRLSPAVEAPALQRGGPHARRGSARRWFGLNRSRAVVLHPGHTEEVDIEGEWLASTVRQRIRRVQPMHSRRTAPVIEMLPQE